MAVLVPHFDLPFRYHAGSFVTVEQDTIEDVTNCIEAIMRTHIGFRTEVPAFGTPDLTFQTEPIANDALRETVTSQEPRAELAWEEGTDTFDDMFVKIVIQSKLAGGR